MPTTRSREWSPLERYGVELWADDRILSSGRWEREIDEALEGCVLGLLLVTAAHLNSEFSWQVEVPALLAGDGPIVWVLVKDCLWQDNAVLSARQGIQDPERQAGRPSG